MKQEGLFFLTTFVDIDIHGRYRCMTLIGSVDTTGCI
jgi:hypothetical protein